jgi:predicted nucleic acid-binding protein
MAGSRAYTVILDACVLYPAPLRDLLMSLAVEGLFRARWTHDIHDEWINSLRANRPDLGLEVLRSTRDLMIQAIPDSLITHHTKIVDCLALPDPDDRHVLAAAIAGHADAIVTFNLKIL